MSGQQYIPLSFLMLELECVRRIGIWSFFMIISARIFVPVFGCTTRRPCLTIVWSAWLRRLGLQPDTWPLLRRIEWSVFRFPNEGCWVLPCWWPQCHLEWGQLSFLKWWWWVCFFERQEIQVNPLLFLYMSSEVRKRVTAISKIKNWWDYSVAMGGNEYFMQVSVCCKYWLAFLIFGASWLMTWRETNGVVHANVGQNFIPHNPPLGLFLYRFLHTMSLWRQE